MIGLHLIFFTILALADPTWRWTNAIDIVEKHDFYHNNEIISRPKDVWQTLFAIRYQDGNLKTSKDCIFYKVPGQEPGRLKIKTISAEKSCHEVIYQAGDEEWGPLKALQFSIEKNFLSLNLTDEKFQITRWDVPLFNVFERPNPKLLMSSAEYRSGKIFFLQPHKAKQVFRPLRSVLDHKLKQCHEIAEDCVEVKPSNCSLCPQGWYEIPNGCPQGPKFCGMKICGLKGAPACRRGMQWQRQTKKYSCREDSSFAYCAKGLRVHCEGNSAYCL